MKDYSKNLSGQVLEDIKEFAEMNEEDIRNLNQFELLDCYLKWNGIIGFTATIREAVRQIYEVKL